MPTTPGQIAKFDPTGNVTDSIITETGGGSIGIGTREPSVRTQIDGTNDPAATLALRRSDNNKFMRLGVGTQGVALDFDPTSFLVIQKNTLGIGGVLAGQELLRVTADGNVGIGTPNPDRPLTVQAQGASQELISFKDAGGATKWHINQDLGGSNPGLNFVETGVADGRLFLKPGGNVGIGTSNPLTKLDVRGDILLPGIHLQQSAQGGGAIFLTQRGSSKVQQEEDSYDFLGLAGPKLVMRRWTWVKIQQTEGPLDFLGQMVMRRSSYQLLLASQTMGLLE